MTPTNPSPLDDSVALQMAALFESLSDPTRLRIISYLLAGEVNVGELVQQLGISKSAVSHQLKGLRDKKVIRTRKQGRMVFVSLVDEHITELFRKGFEHVQHE